nr:hypothetical protein [Tanacetum cinerariifolium]
GGNVLSEKLLDLDPTKYLHPPLYVNPVSGSTTYSSSLNQLLEMFTDEHALDYSSPPLFDEYDDDFLEFESDDENVYDDPFNSKGEKIKESKLLIDELDLHFDFLPSEYNSFISQDFSRVDALSSTNNEDKVFNPDMKRNIGNEDRDVRQTQNYKYSESLESPPIKRNVRRPKKSVRANENKSSSIKRQGRLRKSNDEEKKQTVGSKGKKHKASSKSKKKKKSKISDDENNKNSKIRTRTTPTALFNAMAILNDDRKKRLHEMGFGSMIGMGIHELPRNLGFYVIDNLDTKTNVLSLTDSLILVTSELVNDILGIPMGGCSIESLGPRTPDDPFIKEWLSQFGEKIEIRPNDISDVIVSTKDAGKLFKMNFLILVQLYNQVFEEKKQTIGSKGKKHKASSKSKKKKKSKIYDDENNKNSKIRTRTTPTALFNTMAILNDDRKKRLHEMGFGSMIGMGIHELPKKLGFYVIDNLDTKTNVLSLTDSLILVTSELLNELNKKFQEDFCNKYLARNEDAEDANVANPSEAANVTQASPTAQGSRVSILHASPIRMTKKAAKRTDKLWAKVDASVVLTDDSSRLEKSQVSDENNKNSKIRTRTTPTTLFNVMAIVNGDRKKCLHEMGFGSMIGMGIHELPGKLVKKFEEDFNKKDLMRNDENDDTTSTTKDKNDLLHSHSKMESDSPASDDDNQKTGSIRENKCVEIRLTFKRRAWRKKSVMDNENKDVEAVELSSTIKRCGHPMKHSYHLDVKDEQNNDDSELSNNADAKSEKEDEEFDALAITIGNVCHQVPLRVLMPNEDRKDDDKTAMKYCFKTGFLQANFLDKNVDANMKVKNFEKKIKQAVNNDTTLMKLQKIQFVFFPICFSQHFYVIYFYLQSGSFVLIENNCVENDSANRDLGIPKALHSVFVDFLQSIEHTSYKKLQHAKLEVVKLDFKKRNDHADCGIIVMTAMDCYIGEVKKLKDVFLEGIPYTQLVNLRQMISTKIMMSKINIQKKVYQRRIKSNSKKKNIDSFVCNDYDDSIDEVDSNLILKEFVRDINKSSAECTEDNSNDKDNEDSHSAEEEQNTKDSNYVKTPPVKKRGCPKKIVRANENKSSSVKRRGRPRKSNDESKKQTIGSKRKGREYKVEDDDDNDGTKRMKKKMDHKEAKVKRKRNQKNTKRKFVDESSSEFEVTTTSSKGKKHKKNIKIRTRTTPTALFNAMAILNVDRKKCLYEIGFGSMIGMKIHELPGMLESGNSDLQSMKNKERNEDVHHVLSEDDKVDDSCSATRVCFVIEGDEVKLSEVEDVEKEKQQIGNEDDRVVDDSDTTIPDSITKGKGVKFIKNANVLVDDVPNEVNVLVDDVPNEMIKCSLKEEKISNEELRSQSFKGNVGAEVAVDSQIQSAEDVGCSIPDLDDAKLDVYNGPNLRSPYEYLPVDVKKPVSDVEKIVADTLFAMIGSKLMKMSWRTTRNSIDCGVFTMLHMESYMGAEGEWKCGLAKESKKQNEQLNSLRSKFAAKIILSEFNLLKEKFMKLVQAFKQKTEEERKKTIDDAIANRDHPTEAAENSSQVAKLCLHTSQLSTREERGVAETMGSGGFGFGGKGGKVREVEDGLLKSLGYWQ